jgi:hypothetical protein
MPGYKDEPIDVYFDVIAKSLYQNKRFGDAAAILDIASKYVQPSNVYSVLTSARECYFLSGDVVTAYNILLYQEQFIPSNNTNNVYDKIIYLRYLGKYEECEHVIKTQASGEIKYRALGWFSHKKGDFKEAFLLTEKGRNGKYRFNSNVKNPYPIWDGKTICDNIVVFAETGCGNEIIFSRWLKDLQPYCTNIYYCTATSLSMVFERVFGVKSYTSNTTLPGDTRFIPMMSLPYLLDKDNIENRTYLTSNNEHISQYLPKSRPRIGIQLTGDLNYTENNHRTIPESIFIDTFKLFGELVNIGSNYMEERKDVTYYMNDTWEETLALIDTCDVIVTCCTSIAHAAGALGKKTVVLCNMADYFTWCSTPHLGMSPWYENVWCVRQQQPGNWSDAIDQAATIVSDIIATNS